MSRAETQLWPIGVFASIDAGLGVHLDVAQELNIPTIQLHAPHASSRTPERAKEFLRKLEQLGIRLTAVFGGFEGESYADIPTVEQTVGLVPPATRAARLKEMKEISDFAQLLGCSVVALHFSRSSRPKFSRLPRYSRRDSRVVQLRLRQRAKPAFGNRAGNC